MEAHFMKKPEQDMLPKDVDRMVPMMALIPPMPPADIKPSDLIRAPPALGAPTTDDLFAIRGAQPPPLNQWRPERPKNSRKGRRAKAQQVAQPGPADNHNLCGDPTCFCYATAAMGQITDDSKINYIRCESCDFQTRTRQNLKNHILRKHTDKDKIDWLRCPQMGCGYKTVDKSNFRKHLKRHSGRPHKETVQTGGAPVANKSQLDWLQPM